MSKKPKINIEKCSQTRGKLKFVVHRIKFGHAIALEKVEEYAHVGALKKFPPKNVCVGTKKLFF